jgi:hypothetical protein
VEAPLFIALAIFAVLALVPLAISIALKALETSNLLFWSITGPISFVSSDYSVVNKSSRISPVLYTSWQVGSLAQIQTSMHC